MINNTYGPGPGAYDCSYNSKKGQQTKIGSGKRSNTEKDQTPGPGSYIINE